MLTIADHMGAARAGRQPCLTWLTRWGVEITALTTTFLLKRARRPSAAPPAPVTGRGFPLAAAGRWRPESPARKPLWAGDTLLRVFRALIWVLLARYEASLREGAAAPFHRQ